MTNSKKTNVFLSVLFALMSIGIMTEGAASRIRGDGMVVEWIHVGMALVAIVIAAGSAAAIIKD